MYKSKKQNIMLNTFSNKTLLFLLTLLYPIIFGGEALAILRKQLSSGSYSSNIENKLITNSYSITKLDPNYFNKAQSDNYILGPEDQLEIIISEEFPEFTGLYEIDIDGTIEMRRLGRIYVEGLTKEELNILLEKKLERFFKSTAIEINITSYRPVNVYLDGEVNNPGMYTLIVDKSTLIKKKQNNSLNKLNKLNNQNNSNQNFTIKNDRPKYRYGFPSLFEVIKEAGGVTYYSDLSNVIVTRKNTISNGGGKIRAEINFLEMLESNDFKNNIRIYDNDFITIKRTETPLVGQLSKAIKSNLNPSYIQVSLTGRVEKPGILQVSKASSLNDAILAAGGSKVLKGKAIFIRFKQDGDIDKRKFRINANSPRGSYNNPYLANGDLIHLGKSPFNIASEILTEIFSPYLQIYTFYSIFDD